MTIIDKMELRREELEEKAIQYYLEKTDFNFMEWLFDDDKEEYKKLYKKKKANV